LLHAGTNGFHTGSNHIEQLLDQIDVWENNPGGNPVTVIMARMTDMNPTNPNVTTFNNNVIAMAQVRISNMANLAYPIPPRMVIACIRIPAATVK